MDRRTNHRQKRISRQQEKRAAADVGGRVQANSGASRLGGGGDVRVLGDTRIECKYTESCSYSLKLGELLKLRDQAIKTLESPVFQFQFRGPYGGAYASYAVLPISLPDLGQLDLSRLTRQMNLHEWDLTLWFNRHPGQSMKIGFVDKKKGTVWTFEIVLWDDYLKRREGGDA